MIFNKSFKTLQIYQAFMKLLNYSFEFSFAKTSIKPIIIFFQVGTSSSKLYESFTIELNHLLSNTKKNLKIDGKNR